jgi:hypothetical protein
MRPIHKLLAAMAAAASLPFCTLSAQAGTLGGADFASQYDFREFYTATDNKTFRVVLIGNPFPNMDMGEMARRLLPVMQANKPQPRLTFTYDVPVEPPHPDYRLVLAFDASPNMSADAVCKGAKSVQAGTPGRVKMFSIYCRNDQFLAQILATTDATSPEDPAMASLFRELFSAMFTRMPSLMPQNGGAIPH